jgi:DNA-3-methyladenine glycosylase
LSVLQGDAPEVAPQLLGALIVQPATDVVLRIIETEAYTEDDPASHSYRGPTGRNAAMFGDAGHWYVYFVYGMHWCLNVVTGEAGDGQAVLIRAALVENGWSTVADRRNMAVVEAHVATPARQRLAVDGPAKVAAALAVDGSYDATTVRNGGLLILADDGVRLPLDRQTTRVGISQGTDRLWRFCAAGAPKKGR